MDINYESYKIFYHVALNQSISKAADKLLISQPAVSYQIRRATRHNFICSNKKRSNTY